MKNQCISQTKHKRTDSPVCSNLLKVKDLYLKGRVVIIGNGKVTDFWNDQWCGNFSLRERFANLFEICKDKKLTVAQAAERNCQLSFRRWLPEQDQIDLRKLRDMLERDKQKWAWEKSGMFSVSSMYDHLFSNEENFPNTMLWKEKVPLKNKTFLWLAQHNAILTKDNLLRRKWKGDKRCAFCVMDESIAHLFFECKITNYVWSIAYTVGAHCRPESVEQYVVWCNKFILAGKKFHLVRLAAVF